MQKTINGHNYSVCGESWSTSRAWGHYGYLMRDGELVAKSKIRYYNRTWERYPYQSAMRSAIYGRINELERRVVIEYKMTTGAKRVSAQRKVELYNENTEIGELRELLKAV